MKANHHSEINQDQMPHATAGQSLNDRVLTVSQLIKSHLQLQPMNVVQNEARNRSPHNRRNRRNEKGEAPCLFSSRQPICQIQDDSREVSCFSEAEKKSHNVQLVDRCTTPLSVATMSQLIRTRTTLTDPNQ